MRISDWSSDVCSSDLREREVMIAQDEAVRHEIVRRVDEIEHLTDGPIVRVLHLLLPQPEPLGRRGPAEKGEGLRQHEREIDRQQRLKLRGRSGRRILTDAEDAAERTAIGVADLDRLSAAHDALANEGTDRKSGG